MREASGYAVNPASMARVAGHHRTNNLVSIESHQEELGLAHQLRRNCNLCCVPRAILWESLFPKCLDTFEVLRLVNRDCDHCRCGPV